ncbi:MAG: lyase family protein, partial [Xanthomonadales bacterium]|nr:lyase family protein [Xanthomonadales bacterium]
MNDKTQYRTESDSLGEVQVPVDAWYGAQTQRAVNNFPISGRLPDPDFVKAHVRVKRAAAMANNQAGWLDDGPARAIANACDKILAGEYMEQFVVDRFQAG